jgi:hypothetical protein
MVFKFPMTGFKFPAAAFKFPTSAFKFSTTAFKFPAAAFKFAMTVKFLTAVFKFLTAVKFLTAIFRIPDWLDQHLARHTTRKKSYQTSSLSKKTFKIITRSKSGVCRSGESSGQEILAKYSTVHLLIKVVFM